MANPVRNIAEAPKTKPITQDQSRNQGLRKKHPPAIPPKGFQPFKNTQNRGSARGAPPRNQTIKRNALQSAPPDKNRRSETGGGPSKRRKVARLTGLEPATPGVTGRYSNQLSYNRASVWYFYRTFRGSMGGVARRQAVICAKGKKIRKS